MANKTTIRFAADDLLAAKAATTTFHDHLLKKAAIKATIDDPHVVFGVGEIVAGPKAELAMKMSANPSAFLVIDPPDGITYSELLDIFFGAPRQKKATELMCFTLVMLDMIRRVGDPEGHSLMEHLKAEFLFPLLKMAMEFSNEKVPQKIVARTDYWTLCKM